MNGILDTLVMRERGQADTLAPRLPAMFESTPVIDDAPVALERPRAAQHAAPAPAPPQPARPPVPPVSAATPRPVMVIVPPPPAAQPVQARAPEPPAAHAPPAARVHTLETHTETVVRVERETVAAPAPQRRELPAPPPRTGKLPAPPAPLEAARPVPPSAPPPVPMQPRAPVDVRIVPARAALPVRAQPAAAQPPRQRALPQAAAQALPPVQAPDVHISIGRVEVRASTAPPRPARAAGGPAPVSLDQYLSQRNKRETP